MLALDNVKVLDFGVALSGAAGTQMLADMGADVIKVEPMEGDFFRITATKHEDSPRWMSVNRNKKSIAINLKHDEGKTIIRKLIPKTDVLTNNYRPGAMERLGFSYEEVTKINPRIVYVWQSGFGEYGPCARWVGGDMWAQAMGGVISIQGSQKGPPYIGGVAWVDHGTGMMVALAAMFGLHARERTGVGQKISTSLFETCVAMQTAQMADYLIDNNLCLKGGRGWGQNFPYGAYPAKDGDIVTIFGSSDDEWPIFCQLLNIPEYASDPRYDTKQKRWDRREELYPVLDTAFSKKTRKEWQEIFIKSKLRADPCLTYEELFAHPQITENNMITSVEHPLEGNIRMVGLPIKLEKTPGEVRLPPPRLGEHSREILAELGYSEDKIKSLIEEGIIGIPTRSDN